MKAKIEKIREDLEKLLEQVKQLEAQAASQPPGPGQPPPPGGNG